MFLPFQKFSKSIERLEPKNNMIFEAKEENYGQYNSFLGE